MQEKLEDFTNYKRMLRRGLQAETDNKLRIILDHKQFFSIPWIVCHEYLLPKQ